MISEEFPYLDIAREYQKAGADAISCLTEPKWFLGSDEIFRDVRAAIDLPMLRKDFTVDPYQIYQARLMGPTESCSSAPCSTAERSRHICRFAMIWGCPRSWKRMTVLRSKPPYRPGQKLSG